MESKIYFAALFSLFLVVLNNIPYSNAGACLAKFKNSQEFFNALKSCAAKFDLQFQNMKHGHGEPKNPIPMDEDKCLARCVLEGLKLLASDKTIDVAAVIKDIETNGPTEYQSKLKEAVTTCQKYADANGGDDKTSCKYITVFHICFMKEEHKLCH